MHGHLIAAWESLRCLNAHIHSNDTASDVTAADVAKQQKVKKIQGTGGIQLIVGAKKSPARNLSAMTQVTQPPPESSQEVRPKKYILANQNHDQQDAKMACIDHHA